ncbi:MAG: TonB-dependent receptor [Saprospiraceae bacterium]|nr:TonB-dependent receptor [Saprospiraceae bacterium]
MNSSKLKLIWIALLASQLGFGQEATIQPIPSAPLKDVLSYLSDESGTIFSYSNDQLDLNRPVQIRSGSLEEILNEIFPSPPYQLDFRNHKVIIRKNAFDVTISGYIRDEGSGEILPGATVIVVDQMTPEQDLLTGTTTNNYGFFSLTLPAQPQLIKASFLGYLPEAIHFSGAADTLLSITLKQSNQNLTEVVVTGDRSFDSPGSQVMSTELGKVQLSIGEIQSLPAFLGEVDLVKSIQLLPGVKTLGEGSTNMYVRGGGADQNLILLDEAPVYNPSHLMGFFSVFNQDALNSINFYKGNYPAKYGGRLSSVLDIRMREGNLHRWQVAGGIGTTSARITAQGPLIPDKSSLIISARRTYADLFLKLSADEYTRQTSLFFYDLNAKFNYKISNKDRIYFSGYFGRDLNKIRSLQYSIDWGNTTGTFRWNHVFGDKIFSNLSLIASNYDYLIDLPQVELPFEWKSKIRDYSLKYDFSHYLTPDIELQYGIHSTFHHIRPGESPNRTEESVARSNALEHAGYISNRHQINRWLTLEYGLRMSLFQLMGPAIIEEVDPVTQMGQEKVFQKGQIYKTYHGLEPRFNARVLLSDNFSIKAAYARNNQYLNLLSNLSLGFNVFDIWIPSSIQVKPQIADQWSAGLYFDSKDRQLTYSLEGYYKKLQRQIAFKDHSSLILNKKIEDELLTGTGSAYGVEALVRKTQGRLRGWVGYTYSRSKLKVQGINEGKKYPSPQDQPHKFDFSASYKLNRRWTFSANFIYATGRPISLPVESYWYEGRIVQIYGDKNAHRLPDYHRLDLSANLYRKKENAKNNSYWTFGVYNIYDRHNAATAFVSRELEDLGVVVNSNKSAYHKLYILGIIPSVTYNFKF